MLKAALPFALVVGLATSPTGVVAPAATVKSTPTATTTCVKQVRVWYDSDQYGTYPKAWGELRNCSGPRSLRVRIWCRTSPPRLVYDRSAYSASTGIGTTETTTEYIGWCKQGWLGQITGSTATVGVNAYFYWSDWGYPA